MTLGHEAQRPALALIVSGEEWYSRSLESILVSAGYSVMRAYNAKQAHERIAAFSPDAILLDFSLPDAAGIDFCAQVRRLPEVTPATPVVMISAGHQDRRQRLDALRAGAWDVLGPVVDGEELPLRLGALVRTKFETDYLRDESLIDPTTGLYNLRGILRRAREVGAQAFRDHDSLTCIVVAPLAHAVDPTDDRIGERLAQLVRQASRTADVSGTIAPDTFAILAQGMRADGVDAFARRMSQAATDFFAAPLPMALGFEAVPDYTASPMDPRDLLTHAGAALFKAASEGRAIDSALVYRYAEHSLH